MTVGALEHWQILSVLAIWVTSIACTLAAVVSHMELIDGINKFRSEDDQIPVIRTTWDDIGRSMRFHVQSGRLLFFANTGGTTPGLDCGSGA